MRFVQVWSGNDNGFPRRNWDSHEDVRRDHGPLATGMARGCAAFIQDLKQRGMLEDTHHPLDHGIWPDALVAGRQRPGSQSIRLYQLALRRRHQRRHHARRKRPMGLQAAGSRKTRREVYDIHATILRLLGIDHTKLTFRHNGIDRRLTDVHGRVITKLLA